MSAYAVVANDSIQTLGTFISSIEIEIPALVAISKPRDLRSSRNFTVFALPAFS